LATLFPLHYSPTFSRSIVT